MTALPPLIALVCSSRCPARLVLPAYDLASALRDAGVAVVGGFHTPIERDCLHFLLKGSQPIVICPARSAERMRVPPEWREAVVAGRLRVISPFAPEQRRATAALAAERNRFLAELATAAVVIHAATGSRTAAWSQETRRWASRSSRWTRRRTPGCSQLACARSRWRRCWRRWTRHIRVD